MNSRWKLVVGAMIVAQVGLGAGASVAAPHTPARRAAGQETVRPIALPGSELHELRVADGTEYRIFVALPDEYAGDTDTEFPVLYVLDPAGMFLLVAQTYGLLRIGDEVSPLILVGVGRPADTVSEILANRVLELTPTQVRDPAQEASEDTEHEATSGGADAFLAVLIDEVIPWVENRYQTSSGRGIIGHSLGGLFAMHALIASPDTFSHYLMSSPSLWWDNGVMFERESALAEGIDDLPARVFMSAGTEEGFQMLPDMLRMAEILGGRGYDGLELESQIFPDETHLAVVSAAYSRGLRFLFGCREGGCSDER